MQISHTFALHASDMTRTRLPESQADIRYTEGTIEHDAEERRV